MTQFQSTMKKDLGGTRTLFECNQFRTTTATTSMEDDLEEIGSSSVTRKRPIQSEESAAKKYSQICSLFSQ